MLRFSPKRRFGAASWSVLGAQVLMRNIQKLAYITPKIGEMWVNVTRILRFPYVVGLLFCNVF